MASQPSDKLKAILAEARARAEVAREAAPQATPTRETRRVEALLDRNEQLPDPRALARMYQARDLVERLPEDDDHAPATTPAGPPSTTDLPDRGRPLYTPPPAPTPGAPSGPVKPPLSPAQIRDVMNELREQFTSHAYATFEAKPLPEDVIPFADEPEAAAASPEVAETRDVFYLVGTVIAIGLIVGFVLLALGGPLRYRPPAGGASPSPSATARK